MSDKYDVIVIGGGPAGATCALILARQGFRVCVLEKSRHPRFHIGESILPRTMPLLKELGLAEEFSKLPYLTKLGAEFGFGDDPNTMKFSFTDGLLPGNPIFNIERSVFDQMLIEQARKDGVTVLEETAVRQINRLDDGAVEVATAGGTFSGSILMDASGQGTMVGRHLGLRRNIEDPELQKVSYFQHFENVERLSGDLAGHPGIFMAREGWFWIIGLNPATTSVGFVTRPSFVKEIGVSPDRLLQWAIARTPVVRHRMRDARGTGQNYVMADFSYTCKPYAGPGYFMIGDAACFLDPVFSTGVTLAMVGAIEAARHAAAILRKETDPAGARKQYIGFVTGSSGIFWWLIRNYYRHSFRELFMNGTGPVKMHKAVISILAGQVFPRPAWSLRWRLWAFAFCVWAQQYVALSPRRREFSLLDQPPDELPPERFAAQTAVLK